MPRLMDVLIRRLSSMAARRTMAVSKRSPTATDAAKEWAGWGTALKPAVEWWVLCRKPFPGSVAQNVQKYGTSALNVDAVRWG